MAVLDCVAREEAEQHAFLIDDREGTEGETIALDAREYVADAELVGDSGRVGDHPVDVVLDALDFTKLVGLGHIVMEKAEPTVERHGNGHLVLGDGIHVRGNDG